MKQLAMESKNIKNKRHVYLIFTVLMAISIEIRSKKFQHLNRKFRFNRRNSHVIRYFKML